MAAPSAQARLTLQDAFERFASTVAPDDKRLFHNTQLKDVRDEAMRIERQLRARRTQKNMARLDPFLRGMEHYSKVVEVLCNGTPFLPWIWAPVKLMLTITADSIGAFEKLIEAYGKIGDMLPRLDRLGDALVHDHNFQNVLALVYSDIVEFHRRAYKFVKRKSWSIFFGSMWAGFESRFNGILKNLAYHSELADKEAAAADIAEAVRRSKADDESWEQQEREWIAVKIQKVLAWLGTSDPLPADLLDRHIRDYLPGSCDWFIKHKATELWLGDSAKNPLLWLCGKPGAGKSMICSALVQHAEANDFHVFYYFCSFLGSHSDGPSRLLRSLISQVIQKHQDLAIYVHDVYFKSHPVPTKKALLTLLPELLQGLGSVRLVVDGVDEWLSRDQKDLLKDLSQITSTDQTSHICKIMIASRETIDLSRSLRRKDKSSMTISLSSDDEGLAVTRSIANFINNKLSDLPEHFVELDPDASIMVHVKKTLLEKSHGMFLWVSLVLESLNTVYSPEELRNIVDNLPSDLEALYEQIMTRLCSAPGAHGYGGVPRIMSWICFSRRPLHKSELLQALSMSPHDMGFQMRSIPVASILDHCKPLIEELPDSTIVPVHFSVKEYFLKAQIPQIIPAIDAALDMSSACAVVILRGLELVRLGSNPTAYLALIASGNYRLLPYAIEFWIEHCSQYASGGGSLGLDRPIQLHLARLHEKHRDILHALGLPTSPVALPEGANTGHANEQIRLYSNVPIYGLMADILSLRQLVGRLDADNSSDIEAYVMNNDRTLFSRLAHTYESAVVHLLTQHEVPGITPAVLRAFQESYASTAFRCRFPHCERLSLGFPTAELRLEHETIHVQRLYCQIASCQYNRIGFGKRSALNAHTRKHHGKSNVLLIPAKVRCTLDAETEVEARARDSQNVDSEPRQTDLSDHDQEIMQRLARQLMLDSKEEVRQKFQNDVSNWPEAKKRQLREDGIDPLFARFLQHAESLYREGALNEQAAIDSGVQKLPPDLALEAYYEQIEAQQQDKKAPVYVCEDSMCAKEYRSKDARLKHYRRYHPELYKQPAPIPNVPADGNIEGDPNSSDLDLIFGDDARALENFDFDKFLQGGNVLDELDRSGSPAASQPQSPVAFGELPQWNSDVNNDVAHANLTPQQQQKVQQQPLTEQQRQKWLRELSKLEEQNKKRLLEARMEQDQMGRQQHQQQQQQQQQQQGRTDVPTQSMLQTTNHALQDYQMQRMLLEQQQKKRLLQERQNNLDQASDNDAGWDSSNFGAQPMSQTTNHALQDYQMQRMLLEQQQKKRLLQERQNNLDQASDNDAGWDSSNFGAQPMSQTTNHALQDYQMQQMLFEQQQKKRLLQERQEGI